MSSARRLLRVLPFLASVASTSVVLAATPWPTPVLTAEVLSGVGQFEITRSQTGRLSLVYCGADCTTIRYRELSETGAWSDPETVNTDTGPQRADPALAIVLDPAGAPHVFWDQANCVLHATRQSNGGWSQGIAVPNLNTARERQGGLIAAKIGGDGQLRLITTFDYNVGGGYLFSDLIYAHGPVEGALTIDRVALNDESIGYLSLALNTAGQPVFAVDQNLWGGSHATKLVYNDGSQWQERYLGEGYYWCGGPLQIAIGAAIHVNTCGQYTRLSSPIADVSWIESWPDDMVIDENDIPYFVTARDKHCRYIWSVYVCDYSGSLESSVVRLGTIAADGSRASLAVESPPPSCTGETCPTFTTSRVLYDRGQVLVAYLGKDGGLRVKGYAMDALRCYFSGTAALTLTSVGSGVGTVTREPAGAACGTDTWVYPAETTTVTLRPAPGADSAFRTWRGDCAGSAGDCVLTLEAGVRKEVAAEFNWFPDELQRPRPWRHLLGQ